MHSPELAGVPARIEAENAVARREFFDLVPCIPAGELPDPVGVLSARRAFSVPGPGGEAFPAFQFDGDVPHPVIAEILAVMPIGMTKWQVAFWFVSSNAWLDGASPRDRWSDPEGVALAALVLPGTEAD